MATKININGTFEDCENSLNAFQSAVGGYIEAVRLNSGWIMYVNDEGRLKNLPENDFATLIAGQSICGNVVLLTTKETKRSK